MSSQDEIPVAVSETSDPGAPIIELIKQGDQAAALRLARSLHPSELASAVAGPEIAKLVEYLEPHYRDLLLEELPPERLAGILAVLPDDIATDAVQELTGPEAAQVVADIPAAARESIRELVGYGPDTAAGRMTGRRLSVSSEDSVEQVIETLREVPEAGRVPTIYATAADGKLVGVVNLRALLIAEPNVLVGDVAKRVVAVEAETDQEEAARVLKQYNVTALPVVDSEGCVLGTLTADDLLHVLEEEVTEDMFRLAGVNEEEDLESIPMSLRYRLPWLYANLLTVLLAAWVVSVFEGTLARAAVLAAFLPVVAAQGGNAGLQTVTVMVRSIALGHIAPRDTLRVVRHELGTGLITGLASAIVVGGVIWLWQGNAWLVGLVAIAVTGDVLIGVAAGVVIPIALHAMRQDPALSAAIWLTTVTDVAGFFLYLSLASLVVARL